MPARINPGGGKGQDKLWSDAIRIAALESAKKGGPKKLRQAACKLVELAVGGDLAALKEMGDRLDGKPTQAVQVAGKLEITKIETTIVDPKDSDS